MDDWTSEAAWRGCVRDHGFRCEALGNRLVALNNSRERLSATSV